MLKACSTTFSSEAGSCHDVLHAPLRDAGHSSVLPLLEIVVLIQVGQAIGVWSTLGLLVLAAVAGMMVIRQQGVSMVGRMFDAMSEGRLAVGSIVDSYAKIAAGCLLIVPGFITDALGLALLVPPLRALMLRAMLPGLAGQRRAETPAVTIVAAGAPDRHRRHLQAPRRRPRSQGLGRFPPPTLSRRGARDS